MKLKITNRNFGISFHHLLVIMLVMSVLLAACQSQPTVSPEAASTEASPTEPLPTQAPIEPTPEALALPELLDFEWVLIGYGDALNPVVVEPGTRPTAIFGADRSLHGSASCNNYNTTFQVEGENISFGPAASTRMACEVGMEQETAFLTALETASTYIVDGERLLIAYDSGAGFPQQLVFVRETPLTDTLWILISYGDPDNLTPSETGVVTSATFDQEGNLSGSAGCNTYNSGYSAQDGQISIGLPAVTMMACEMGMEQESAYLAALESAQTYRIGNGLMEITYADGAGVLRFSARHMPLENVRWVLTMIDGQPVLEGLTATVVFTPADSPAAQSGESTVNGNGGCNGFFGAYTTEGNTLSLPGPFGMTQMLCPDEVMQSEQALLAGLENAQSYETILHSLTITTDTGTLVFYADRLPLEGPVWTLTTFGTLENPRPPIEGAQFTASFARQFAMPSGRQAGGTGCNDYTSVYYASLSEIKFNLPEKLANTCSDALLEEEQAYFLGLNSARQYRILGNVLQVFFGDQVLTFNGAYPPVEGTPGPLLPLNGMKWWLTSIGAFLTVAGTEVTAEFAINPDGLTGQIIGSSGCNSYNGEITGVFTIGGLSATQALCETPEGIMEQESSFLAALNSATEFSLEGDTLRIITSLGVLNFTNITPAPIQPLPPTETPEAVLPLPGLVAMIVAPTEGQVDQVILFDGSGSTSDSEITAYSWDFGDGMTADGITVEHTFTAPGVYTVTLTITDIDGQTNSVTHEITIT